MAVRKYEMPWRSAYEIHAALAWVIGVLVFTAWGLGSDAPTAVLRGLASGCVLMALYRVGQALRILSLRASLSGRAMQTIAARELRSYCSEPTQVWLGFGFEWKPVHSQRLYELAKVDFRDYRVSPWLLRMMGYRVQAQPDSEIGLPYIHGVEPDERRLYRPLLNFEGGTCIVGTTQSGKGVALSILASQAVYRGDVVIVLDPKNSNRLKNNIIRACADADRSDAFLDFHPAFPDRGVRLDPMFNWQKPTELASRIQAIMPPDTAGSFSAFGWDAVNVVIQGVVDLEDRPNLTKLARYIEGGIDPLLYRSLERLFQSEAPTNWRELIRPHLKRAADGKIQRPSPGASNELLALVAYYASEFPAHRHTKVIDSQLRVFRHPREHYQKITANLLPILSMLTAGDLGRSLSPDPFDPDDPRPIMNLEKIIRGRHVFYIALDSLPDPAVATAIAAIVLADLAALAGMRYNLGINSPRISLFVDEVSNCMNQPLIEILNKGAESGIYTTCSMQTLADLAKRLGSEAAARMALGNLNNLIALRSKDRPTQDFIVETFGRTYIHSLDVSHAMHFDEHLPEFSGSYSRRLRETLEETIPADILGKLPNLQYFASVSGGRLVKGRMPILNPGDAVMPPA